MQADRFVTICLVYSGLVLLAQYALVYRFSIGIGGLAQLGVALSILSVGLIRLRNSEAEDQNPAEYGLFTYGMAALSVLLTVIVLIQLPVV